jgi:hypothetical protein
MKAVVEALKEVNDVAEIAIALMTNYNENLTKRRKIKTKCCNFLFFGGITKSFLMVSGVTKCFQLS